MNVIRHPPLPAILCATLTLAALAALAATYSARGSNEEACGDITVTAAGSNGVFARVRAGRIETSDNGSTWTGRSVGARTFLRGISYARNVFVAVGGSYSDEPGVIVTSRDGMTWTRRHSQNRINLHSVASGRDLFVAVGDEGTILTSADGTRWQRQSSATSTTLAVVTFGRGVFVAGGESGLILVSTNGTCWTARNLGRRVYVGNIVFSRDHFVVHSGPATFESRDGLNWRATRAEGADWISTK